jgi:hypothetical protein
LEEFVLQQTLGALRAAAAPAFRYLGSKMAGPKVSTALTGLEAASAGYGINEMAKGVRDGDTGQF